MTPPSSTLRSLLRGWFLVLTIALAGAGVYYALLAQSYWAPLEINAKQWEPGVQNYWKALLFYAAAVAASWVLFWLRPKQSIDPTAPVTNSVRTGRVQATAMVFIGFAAVLFLAQSLRFYGLEELPPGLWLDEGINVMDAELIQKTGNHSIYLHSMSTQRTAMFVEVLTQTLKLPWPSRVVAVRGTAAILGMATIIFFFLLGWALVSARFGLLIAFLMAVSHWHINYSRWGMEQILCPLFEVAALACLFLAMKGGSRRPNPFAFDELRDGEAESTGSTLSTWLSRLGLGSLYLLAGLFLGGGIYTYSNYRLFLIAMAIFLLVLPLYWIKPLIHQPRKLLLAGGLGLAGVLVLGLVYRIAGSEFGGLEEAGKLELVNGRPISIFPFIVFEYGWMLVPGILLLLAAYTLVWSIARRDWVGFLMMFAVACLAFYPFAVASLSDWYAFTKRAGETSVLNGPNWEHGLRTMASKTLLGMHWIGDQNGRHNLPFATQLSLIPAGLSVLGLLLAALTFFRPLSLLLILLVFFGLVPDMVTWESPHASRMLDALAPMLILAGLAWKFLTDHLRAVPWVGGAAAVFLTAVGCIQVFKDDYRLYFVDRPASRPFYESFLPDEAYAARFAGSVPKEVSVYVDPQLHSKHNFWFYQGGAPHETGRFVSKFDVGGMPIPTTPNERAVFVVMRSGQSLVEWLQELYPQAKVTIGRNPWGEFNFAAFEVTREQMQQTAHAVDEGSLSLSHGLLATFYKDNDVIARKQVPRLLDWNLLDATHGVPPTRVTWEGFVWQPDSGHVHIGSHPENVTIEIGETAWTRGKGPHSGEGGQYVTRPLTAGLHPFRAQFDHGSGYRVPMFVWLMWRAPGSNLPSPTAFPSDRFSAPPRP